MSRDLGYCLVYLSEQFNVDLGHTIDGQRSLHGDVRAGVLRRGGTERSNRTRTEEPQIVQFTNFNDVVKPSNIDLCR